jgi:hypothetical protein
MSTGVDRLRQAREAVKKAAEEEKAAVAAMAKKFGACEVNFRLDEEAIHVTLTQRPPPSENLPIPGIPISITLPLPVAVEVAKYLIEIAAAEQGVEG